MQIKTVIALLVLLCTYSVESARKRTRNVVKSYPPTGHVFNEKNFDPSLFLTPFPADTLLQQSYAMRETLDQILKRTLGGNTPDRDMATTEARLHLKGSKFETGVVQFRQVSDMWLTEIKGVIQDMPAKKQIFLIIHNSTENTNLACSNLGNHLDPHGLEHGIPALFSDIKGTRLSTHLGDIGLLSVDENGFAPINYQNMHISLYHDNHNILGHAIAVHEVLDAKGTVGHIIACGNIAEKAKYAPAKFMKTKKPKRPSFFF